MLKRETEAVKARIGAENIASQMAKGPRRPDAPVLGRRCAGRRRLRVMVEIPGVRDYNLGAVVTVNGDDFLLERAGGKDADGRARAWVRLEWRRAADGRVSMRRCRGDAPMV